MTAGNDIGLLSTTLDGIEDHVAVITPDGDIVYVNDRWNTFGVENGFATSHSWLATNYFHVCKDSADSGDLLAAEALTGIDRIVSGEAQEFCLEYPCHSPWEHRWFRMRAIPLTVGDSHFVLVTHGNITRLKCAEDLSLYDPLTGLANRRLLDIDLRNEWRRCHREQKNLGLMMVDIDNFKAYNDEYGHIGGDRCLCAVANIIKNYSRRPGDFAARYGGDEFVIVIGSTSIAECISMANSILHTVDDIKLGYGQDDLVSVSIGVVAGVPGTPGLDPAVIELADDCLYKSKRDGRNKVHCSVF